MQMFAGTFAMCTEDPSIPTVEACKEAGNTWENPPGNSFDNFGSAMLALFLQVRSPLIAMDCHGLPFEHTCFAAPSSRSPHDLPTISPRSPHDLLTISSRSRADLGRSLGDGDVPGDGRDGPRTGMQMRSPLIAL